VLLTPAEAAARLLAAKSQAAGVCSE